MNEEIPTMPDTQQPDAVCADDVAAARKHALDLISAQAGGLAWVGAAVGLSIIALFGATLLIVLMRGVPPEAQALANVLLGVLGTCTVAVVMYYHGSTAGSRRKDDRRAAETMGKPDA